MPVSDQGVVTDQGISFSWDELNNHFKSDKARAAILAHSGLTKDQIPQVLKGLREFETEKYSNWQSQQINKDIGKIPAMERLESHLPSFLGGGKIPKKEKTYSEAEILKQSGFGDLLSQIGTESKVQQVAGGGAGQTLPAISAQALQEYTKNYILPAQAQLNNMIQGDMSQWQSAINSIAHSTGQAGSPVTQAWQEYAKVQSPIYQSLAAATARQGLTAPWTTLMNQAIGENAKIGERAMALGSTYQTLQQMGLLDPNAAQAISGGGIGALSSILGGSANTSGVSPLTTITQAATSGNKPFGVP